MRIFIALLAMVCTATPAAADVYTWYGSSTCSAGYSPVFSGRVYSSASGDRRHEDAGSSNGMPPKVEVLGCLPDTAANSSLPQAVFDMVCVVCKRD